MEWYLIDFLRMFFLFAVSGSHFCFPVLGYLCYQSDFTQSSLKTIILCGCILNYIIQYPGSKHAVFSAVHY